MSFGSLGSAKVDITADLSGYEAALARLPDKFADAERKIRAEMARNRLDLKSFMATGATTSGAIGDYDALIAKQEQLKQKLQSVAKAAGEAAGAMGTMTAAGGRGAAGLGALAGGLGRVGDRGGYGAMKLMLLAQTLDDVAYGLRAVVNNIPILLQAFGVSDKAAAAISIGAVALNQFVQKWGEWADLLKDTPLKPVVDQVNELAKAWGNANQAAEFHAKSLKDAAAKAKAAAGVVDAVKPAGQAAQGHGVEQAIAAFGGGIKLRDFLMDQRLRGNITAGNTAQDAEKIFNDLIAKAIAGEGHAITELARITKGSTLPAQIDYHSPQATAERKLAEEEVERMRRERDKAGEAFDRAQEKAGEDEEKRSEAWGKIGTKVGEDIAEGTIKATTKDMGQTSQVHGIESYLTAIQTAALQRDQAADQIPGKIDQTNQKLDQVNQNLGKLKMARFG